MLGLEVCAMSKNNLKLFPVPEPGCSIKYRSNCFLVLHYTVASVKYARFGGVQLSTNKSNFQDPGRVVQ